MVNQTKAMQRLNLEREYEDELVETLALYFLANIEMMPDLTDPERDKLKQYIGQIRQDSNRHSDMFSMLLQMVIEDGERQY